MSGGYEHYMRDHNLPADGGGTWPEDDYDDWDELEYDDRDDETYDEWDRIDR